MYPTPDSRTGPSTRSQRPAGARRLAGVVVWGGLLVALAGCSGGIPTAMPTLTMPSLTVPTINITVNPPTIVLPTGGPPSSETASPTSSPRSDNSSTSGPPPWLWVVVGVAAVAAVVAAIASVRRRKEYVDALVNDIVSRGNWVVDHGVHALLGAWDATAVQQAWSQLDGALVDLSADVTKLDGRVRGDKAQQIREVRDSTAALRLAAETQARTRLSAPPTPSGGSSATAPTQSTEALFSARRRLATAIAVLDPSAPATDSGTSGGTT